MTTNEQCLKTTLEKLEVDGKLRRQQFGSHIEGAPERDPSPVPKPSPRIIRKTDQESFSDKGIYFSCSRIKDHIQINFSFHLSLSVIKQTFVSYCF